MREETTPAPVPTYDDFRATVARLCRRTTPAGHEAELHPLLPRPAAGGSFSICPDTGNVWVHVPGPGDEVLWTSHLDTADDRPTRVALRWDGDVLASDGRTILGADDRVGVAILDLLIRAGVPGTYAFFAAEEVGRVGSIAAAEAVAAGRMPRPRAVLSLDRRGTDSCITHQLGGQRCCPDAWAAELCRRIRDASGGGIRLTPDPTGSSTDSASYMGLVERCTNLSVGYLHAHTPSEVADVRFAYRMALALVALGRGEGVPEAVGDAG